MTAVFRDLRLLRWYLVILVNMFMVGILFGFLPVYVNSLGYGQLKNGLILTGAAASYLLAQPVAGHLADRFDPTRVVLVGLALSTLSLLVIPFTAGVLLVCAVVAGGIGVGTVWTNTDAVVSDLAKEGRLAATLGAAGSFKELGDMLGPLLNWNSVSIVGSKSRFHRLRSPRIWGPGDSRNRAAKRCGGGQRIRRTIIRPRVGMPFRVPPESIFTFTECHLRQREFRRLG